MSTIQVWKFPLILKPHQTVKMPERSVVRHFGIQEDRPTIWAEVLTANDLVEERIEIYGTGQSVDMVLGESRRYIGTAQQGPFVWHCYHVTTKDSPRQGGGRSE